MPLCNLFQAISIEPNNVIANGGTFKHYDIVGLQSSAASGCHLCLIVWNDASRTQKNIPRLRKEVEHTGAVLEDQIVVIVNKLDAGEDAAYGRLMAFLDDPDARHQIAGCSVLYEEAHRSNESNSNERLFLVAGITSITTGLPESLDQLATWIRNCLGTHPVDQIRPPGNLQACCK